MTSAKLAWHRFVDAFERDRLELEKIRYVIARVRHAVESDEQQRATRRVRNEPDARFEYDDERSFAPHERLRDVESFLRKQVVKVVA